MNKQIKYLREVKRIIGKYLKKSNCEVGIWSLSLIYLLISVLNIISMFCFSRLMENSISLFNYRMIFFYLIAYAASSLLIETISYLSEVIRLKVKRNILTELRGYTIKKVMHAKYEWVENQEIGDNIGRILNNILNLSKSLSDFIPSLIRSIIISVLSCIILFFINFEMTIVFLILVVITINVQIYAGKYTEPYLVELYNKENERNALFHEIIMSKVFLNLYNTQNYMNLWIHEKTSNYTNALAKSMYKMTMFFSPAKVFNSMILIIPLCFGVDFYLNGKMEMANLIFALSIMKISSSEMKGLDTLFANLSGVLADIKIMENIWSAPEDEDGKVKKILSKNQIIEFRNCSFGYQNSNELIIKSLYLEINKGEKVAIIGRSGSGKSTILKLMDNLYQPSSGSVYIYGVRTEDWDKKSFYENISYLDQNVPLFGTSIKQNLTLGKSCDMKQVNELLVMMDLSKFLIEKEDDIDFIINNKIDNISGGERQRLGLIREILKNTNVLLLDEYSSALDSSIEEKVTNYLVHKTDLTVVSNLHKLILAKKFSRLIILQDGSIVEDGDFKTLYEKKGYFYKLYIEGERK